VARAVQVQMESRMEGPKPTLCLSGLLPWQVKPNSFLVLALSSRRETLRNAHPYREAPTLCHLLSAMPAHALTAVCTCHSLLALDALLHWSAV
jgi:hypothetical protein